jgi:hypothetical protein
MSIHPALRQYLSQQGKIGGKARAEKLSPKRKRQIAMMGVRARLANKKKRRS